EQDYIARNIAGQNSKQAKGRRKRLERLPRLGPVVGPDGAMALRFEVTERGGDQVVTAKNVSVAVGTRTLVERFSGTLERTGVVGIIGRNGAGKSTLLRALLGEHPLQGGELRLGASITTGYYRQDLSQVPLDGTLYEVMAVLRPKWERGEIQRHLGRFGFSGQEVLRRADSLSGGERARVALAMLMLSGANLLILDGPTHHLDVESIEALEDAIDGYDGTVILVSHDRALLRALTTRIWILHGRHMTEFAGGYAEWEQVSTERAHAAAVSAAEEQALRQVHERHRVAPSPKSDPRKDLRRAQRELEGAEAERDERRGVGNRTPGVEVHAQRQQGDARHDDIPDDGPRDVQAWEQQVGEGQVDDSQGGATEGTLQREDEPARGRKYRPRDPDSGGGTGRDREAASYSGHVRERPRAPDHQHHPHARDGRGAGGEVGAPRDTDGDGSGGLLSVAGVPALRSRRSHLAEPGSVRALDGPRVDAALFDARARGREGGERQVRAAGPARPDARRHQALPSAGQ